MRDGGRDRFYSDKPLSEEDFAHHREMWEDFERRQWLRHLIGAAWKWSLGVPPFIVGLYAIFQAWRGSK